MKKKIYRFIPPKKNEKFEGITIMFKYIKYGGPAYTIEREPLSDHLFYNKWITKYKGISAWTLDDMCLLAGDIVEVFRVSTKHKGCTKCKINKADSSYTNAIQTSILKIMISLGYLAPLSEDEIVAHNYGII